MSRNSGEFELLGILTYDILWYNASIVGPNRHDWMS